MIRKSLKKLDWEKRFSYVKNIIFDEKTLLQQGAKFQIVRFLPKTKIEPHFHKNVCEIFYIRSGKGIFLFNNKKYKGKKDDIFLVQPNDIHEIINESDDDLIILIFKTNEDPNDIFWIKSGQS